MKSLASVTAGASLDGTTLPDAAELAALRAWHEGSSSREAVDRYLAARRAAGESARGVIGRIRSRLAMRHTHASHALQRGAEITTVRDNLRHSSVATTSVYLHTDDLRRARQIREAFAGKGPDS